VRSLRSGAKGFISKGQDPRSVFAAIDTVVGGGRAIDPEYLDLVLSAVDDGTERLPHESLSNREYEIMMRLAEGQALQSIAEDLNISPKTVSTYRRRTLEKMGFSRNSQLTEYVLRYLRPPS
jgi:DNA-binding NarL/FixJ family response regulator